MVEFEQVSTQQQPRLHLPVEPAQFSRLESSNPLSESEIQEIIDFAEHEGDAEDLRKQEQAQEGEQEQGQDLEQLLYIDPSLTYNS